MRRTMIGVAVLFLAAWTTAVPALAQTSSLTAREVVGSWVLRFMPSERRGVSVRGRPEMPVTIAVRGGALACAVDGGPATCAIRNGALVIAWTQSEAVMRFTLPERIRDGFSGNARIRVRQLPFSGDIGPVNMLRAVGR